MWRFGGEGRSFLFTLKILWIDVLYLNGNGNEWILITTVCFLFWNYWNIAEITIKKAKSSPCSQSFSSKQKTSASVPKSPHLFNSSSTATAQKPLPPIRHICGLGASVGCERVERTFNAPRLKSQICLIGSNGFVCSLSNELNSNFYHIFELFIIIY